MRLMRPLTTEEECLKCHRQQGYKVGDIRGGISISVPWEPYEKLFIDRIYPFYGEMAVVWLVGFLGLLFSSKRINTLFTALQETQALLVHQEKMASLGQMTAGIAHEINNPLAFVLGNEQVLQWDFDDLLAFINTLGDTLPEIATTAPHLHAQIVANAIQASQPGQVVRVSTRKDGDWDVIEVVDQGSGIAAEHLDKIFDPFFTTKPDGSGTGLGLSIAQQVVTAHHGKIEVESKPGAGTMMRILLPARVLSC